MNTFKRTLVVGATSKIAQCVIIELAKAGTVEFNLVARNKTKLERFTNDLQIRNPNILIKSYILNDSRVETIEKIVEDSFDKKEINLSFIAIGDLGSEQELCTDHKAIPTFIETNVTLNILFSESIYSNVAQYGGDVLAITGSIAGERGRAKLNIYGACKGFLNSYVAGLQQKVNDKRLQVKIIKPGPVATPMTANLTSGLPLLATPEKVATQIVKGLAKKTTIIYAPPIWRLIMLVLRNIPAVIFNKLKF